MEPARPLDALNKVRDKRIIVELKNNKQYTGKLKSFDIHINIVIEDVEERFNGEMTRKLGTVFIRGDTITVISTEQIQNFSISKIEKFSYIKHEKKISLKFFWILK